MESLGEQDHGSSAATTGHGESASPVPAGARSKTGLRGVSVTRSGNYGARLGRQWLGSFATAAAAAALFGAKAVLNNLKAPAEAGHGDTSAPGGGASGGEVEESPRGQKQEVPAAEAEADRRKKKKRTKAKARRKAAAGPDPTRFIGVRRPASAQINQRGADARTNFKQHDDGDAPAPFPVPSSNGVVPMPRSCPPSPFSASDIAEGLFGEHGTNYGGVNDIHDEPIALNSSNTLPVLPLDDLGISLSSAGAEDFLDFTELGHLID